MPLKILLYSSVFSPSIGGMEMVAETIALNLVQLGHVCVVMTETPDRKETPRSFPFQVIRSPSLTEKWRWVKWADVVHSKGASLALYFHAKWENKPFVWTHAGYQVSCIDGLGWVEGEKAPISPWASFLFHKKRFGLLKASMGYAKLLLRRWCAEHVDSNVAITNWMNERQPFKNQIIIYNPFPLSRFKEAKRTSYSTYDFIYVGRLVSEKGVATLLKAFSMLVQDGTHAKLAIVGDGNWRERLEVLANKLDIKEKVIFFGRRTGQDLLAVIEEGKIAVVPSEWEEPMGGVALELLAAGKNIIVSKRGGLAECIGDAGLTFQNGDEEELYSKMKQLLTDSLLQKSQLDKAAAQLAHFDERVLTQKYVELYYSILA